MLNITEVRYNTGLVSKLDVAQAKSVYFSTKASVPQLESGISQYINSLAILLGTYPQEIRPTLERIGKLPDYMEPVGVGLPADLLLRRPDVRQAERLVNAQAALLGASKSDWLPQVFLKGSVGYAARDLKDLTRRKSMTFEIAPTPQLDTLQRNKAGECHQTGTCTTGRSGAQLQRNRAHRCAGNG